MIWSFAKYSGLGNDFIIIHKNASNFPVEAVPDLCARRLSIGADGLILSLPASDADVRFVIYNADGSRAPMCGNGLRCLADYIFEQDGEKKTLKIQSDRTIHRAKRLGEGRVSVSMGEHKILGWQLEFNGVPFSLLDTGVNHAVVFVSDLGSASMEDFAPKLRKAHDCNVNFAKVQDAHLEIRTYERGVEGETLACGTGACAAALTTCNLHKVPYPITVKVRSGEEITVSLDKEELWQTGAAKNVFRGTVEIP